MTPKSDRKNFQFYPELWLLPFLVGPLFIIFAGLAILALCLWIAPWVEMDQPTLGFLSLFALLSIFPAWMTFKILKPSISFALKYSERDESDLFLEGVLSSFVATYGRGRIRFLRIVFDAKSGEKFSLTETRHSFSAKYEAQMINGNFEKPGRLFIRNEKPYLFESGNFRIWL